MLYRPTGESHWVRWPSYLLRKGEEGRVAERGPLLVVVEEGEAPPPISGAVARRGAGGRGPLVVEEAERVGNCLLRYEERR